MNLPVLPGVSIRLIQRIVCDRFRLPLDTMESPSRLWEHAHPRQLAMRLSREFTHKSLPNIGRHFGGRDHTTVIHAIRAVEQRNQRNAEARQHYAELRAALEMIAPKPAEVSMPDLYAELGLEPGATSEDIKAAHRRKVREHHPDRGGNKATFQAVQLAYDTLRDQERRKRYDETGETAGATNDPAVQMLGAIVENLIGQMLQDGVPFETIDMHRMMVDAVGEKVAEMVRERGKAEREIAKAADLAKRWKRKRRAKGPDLIGDTIRRRERDLRETLVRLSNAEDAWKRAGKLLEDYEYRFDRRPAPSAMTWTGGGIRFVHVDLSR
jgi:curved DNA-binding protein CbpA